MLIQNTDGLYRLAKELVEKRASQSGKRSKQPQRK
jgi:hypothetical protein